MKFKAILKQSGIFLTLISIGSPIIAAPVVGSAELQSVIGAVDPGRVTKQVKQSIPVSPTTLTAPRSVVPASFAMQQAGKISFKLTQVIIKGNTVIPTAKLQAIFQSSINKKISLLDLQAKVHSITTTYREAGYILSRAFLPPQTIKNGIVNVQVVEGFISSFNIKGDGGANQKILQKYGIHITEARPLKIATLERYTLLANDLPGYSVQAVINPSKTVAAGADLTFLVTKRKASAYVTYDNFGTRYIGPNQTMASTSLYSLIRDGDSSTLRFSTTSRPHELQFAELSHSTPIGGKGMRLSFGSNYTETRPQFILAPVNIIGRNLLVFTDLSYPLIRERSRQFTLHAGANYQNLTTTILSFPFYQDRIRSLVIGGDFTRADNWLGVNHLRLDMTHGFHVLGAKDHLLQSLPEGHSQYTKYNITISRDQGITTHFSLFGSVQSQLTEEKLLSAEQYGFGGADYGRGYDPSTLIGNRGVSGKVELRLDTAPSFRLLNTIQYYIFYDVGIAYNNDTINFLAKQTAASAGGGLRIQFLPQVTGNVYLAKALTFPVATQLILGRNPNSVRSYFQFVVSV